MFLAQFGLISRPQQRISQWNSNVHFRQSRVGRAFRLGWHPRDHLSLAWSIIIAELCVSKHLQITYDGLARVPESSRSRDGNEVFIWPLGLQTTLMFGVIWSEVFTEMGACCRESYAWNTLPRAMTVRQTRLMCHSDKGITFELRASTMSYTIADRTGGIDPEERMIDRQVGRIGETEYPRYILFASESICSTAIVGLNLTWVHHLVSRLGRPPHASTR